MATKPDLEIKMTPSKQRLQARMRLINKEIKGLAPAAHKKTAIFLDQWVQDNFKGEGALTLGGWAPFKHGGRVMDDGSIDTSAKLLQDTGRLRASFLPFASSRISGVGSDLDYSIAHEEGIKWLSLPARRMLPLTGDVDEQLKHIWGDEAFSITKRVNRRL